MDWCLHEKFCSALHGCQRLVWIKLQCGVWKVHGEDEQHWRKVQCRRWNSQTVFCNQLIRAPTMITIKQTKRETQIYSICSLLFRCWCKLRRWKTVCTHSSSATACSSVHPEFLNKNYFYLLFKLTVLSTLK